MSAQAADAASFSNRAYALDWARAEYERSRAGTEKYDEHLFRIRSWNIALSALLLATFFRVNVTGGGARLAPSGAVFIFVSICCCFWTLDSLNKSLQIVHIQNQRDLEEYMRGSAEHYVGPTISLRFRRKQKRHSVAIVKNLVDSSLVLFYILPITIFCVAMLATYGVGPAPCFGPTAGCRISGTRTAATIALVMIVVMMVVSACWRTRINATHRRTRTQPFGKFIGRRNAKARRDHIYALQERLSDRAILRDGDDLFRGKCAVKAGEFPDCPIIELSHKIGPFRADFHNPAHRTLVFIDRVKIFDDRGYRREREQLVERCGYSSRTLQWSPERLAWPLRRALADKDQIATLAAFLIDGPARSCGGSAR